MGGKPEEGNHPFEYYPDGLPRENVKEIRDQIPEPELFLSRVTIDESDLDAYQSTDNDNDNDEQLSDEIKVSEDKTSKDARDAASDAEGDEYAEPAFQGKNSDEIGLVHFDESVISISHQETEIEQHGFNNFLSGVHSREDQ